MMQRITQRSIADNSMANLQTAMARGSRLQEQLSSGKQIVRPSDSPAGTTDVLQLRAQRQATEQYIRNAENGVSWLDTADNALQQASTSVRRARDLTVQGTNSALGQSSRNALAAELGAVKQQLLELANAQYLGRPVFGGTTGGGVAFDATGTFVGDAGTVSRRVGPESTVRVDVDGVGAFGTGTSSVFAQLDAIIADLQAGLPVDGHLTGLDASLDRVTGSLADVGARTNRVENLRQVASDAAITLRSSQSEIEDVDLPKTILELQLQQTAYQAALGATARVIQPSLLDFLR